MERDGESFLGGGGGGGSLALSSCRCTVELSWVGCICLGEKLGVTHDCNVLILLGFTEFTIIYFLFLSVGFC